jgi:hypothetical protein
MMTTESTSNSLTSITRAPVRERLAAYFEDLERKGLKVPRHRNTDRPALRVIERAIGTAKTVLSHKVYRTVVEAYVEKLGLEDEAQTKAKSIRDRCEQAKNTVEAYVRHLRETKQKLPENVKKKGTVDYGQVASETGLSWRLLNGTPRLRSIVKRAHKELGCEVRLLDMGQPRITISYASLLEFGTKMREGEVSGHKHAKQYRYSTRSGLYKWLEAVSKGLEHAVGLELTVDFAEKLVEVSEGFKGGRTLSNFRTEARRWRGYYQALLGLQDIPESFHEALSALVAKSGLTIWAIEKLADLRRDCLGRWMRNEITPNYFSLPAVARLEEFFGVPPGTLTGRLANRSRRVGFRRRDMPAFLQEDKRLYYKVVPHLPGTFVELPEADQRSIVEDVLANICRMGTEYSTRTAELCKLPYVLKKWPKALLAEREYLCNFKTSELTPVHMRRNGVWRESTKTLYVNLFSSLFGALSAPANAEHREMRGLGIPHGDLCFAMIACPKLMQWFLEFRKIRRGQFNSMSIDICKKFRAQVRQKFGWIRQTPKLAKRLRPVRGYVNKAFIERAKRNWDKVCDEAVDFYTQKIEELSLIKKTSRDPFKAIEGIVESADPIDSQALLIEGLMSEYPDPATAPIKHAIAVRNCVASTYLAITGLREKHITGATYRKDNSGQIRQEGDVWAVEIPRECFKDPESSFFGPADQKEDFKQVLPDWCYSYANFKLYVEVCRPLLLNHYHQGGQSDCFIINIGPTPQMSEKTFSTLYRRCTARHLAENKAKGTGIPKVRPHRPHSVRHIRGTHIAKTTGSMDLAADANQNTPGTARKFYAKFTPKDRTALATRALFPNASK